MAFIDSILLIVGLITPILALIGFATIMLFVLLKSPIGIKNKIAWRLWDMATLALFPSRLVMLIRKEDGDYSFREAQYDEQNQGYWVKTIDGDKRNFFQSTGQQAGTFGPIRLLSAYEGFGVATDFVSARIAEEAEHKYVLGTNDPVVDETGQEIEEVLAVPERGIIDLRKIKYLAPFNCDPDRYYRIEENAKAAMMAFKRQDAIVQGAMILSAFILGSIMTWFAMSQGAGGGGMPEVPINM